MYRPKVFLLVDDPNPFDRKVQEAELDYLMHSPAALTSPAENCVGLPFED